MEINFLAIFLTGLLTGGLTCLAVQGGLLAASIAQREEEKIKENSKNTDNLFPILVFLVSKLVAYTLLGFLLGWFGSLFQLSPRAQVFLQFAVVVFMLGTALNILNAHPIFRYFVIQPPRFLMRLVKKQSRSKEIFAPALLGFFTVFIPCGTTQAMMALAIGGGSPVLGASILFAFVLGTSPVFFLLGYLTTKLSESLHHKFMKITAYLLIILAVFNLNGAIALSGSNLTIDSFLGNVWCSLTSCKEKPVEIVEEAVIQFYPNYYSPNIIKVKRNSQVKLNLVNNNGDGCIQAFVISSLGVYTNVYLGSSKVVEFTAPEKPGRISFMCGMGMYRGVIQII